MSSRRCRICLSSTVRALTLDVDDSRTGKIAVEKIRSEQQSATRTIQSLSNSIHAREMELSRKRQELKDKEALEARQNDARAEVANLEKQSKVNIDTSSTNPA